MSSFCKLSLVLSSVALAVVGCKKSSGGSDSASSSNDAQAASSQDTAPAAATTQDYLLIGAPNASKGMGAVLICNLDGSSCSQFLGGESTIASAKSLKLQPGDKFGTSITVTASSIFVGTASKTGGSGEVYKFDLSGKSEETIDIADLFQEKQYFGKSIFATSKSLFVGALQRKNDAATSSGALLKCDLDGTNCADLLGGSDTSPSTTVLAQSGATSGFGASVFANDKNLFVGSQGGIGKVFKCDADGGNCLPLDTSKLALITNDNLGSTAIVGNDKNIFISAVGRD